MSSVSAFNRVKSPITAFAPGFADTVTVVIALEAWSSVAVTVLIPPFSEIDDADSESVTVGVASSSVIVPVPVRVVPPPEKVALFALLSSTFTTSFGSSVASPMTEMAMDLLVSLGAKVSVPGVRAV